MSDEVIAILNEKLNIIAENLDTERTVQITYFVPDDKKASGAYVTHTGIVRKIDLHEPILIMTDGKTHSYRTNKWDCGRTVRGHA